MSTEPAWVWDLLPLARNAWPNRLIETDAPPGQYVVMEGGRKPVVTYLSTGEVGQWRTITRRGYRPTKEDLATVRRHFPQADSGNPSWEQIRARLIVTMQHKDIDLATTPAATLLALLERTVTPIEGNAHSLSNPSGPGAEHKSDAGNTHHEETSEPDSAGYVKNPADRSAYIPMTTILNEHIPEDHPLHPLTEKRLRAFLQDFESNQVRWTRPNGKSGKTIPNRRSVHLTDWKAFLDRTKSHGGDAEGFPRLSEAQIERRKDAIRKTKSSGL